MRPISVTQAIVLRSWPFGESDRVVSFLTEGYGKVTGIAKGAQRSRKRFVNTLEPFSLVNLRFQDRSHRGLVFICACELARPLKRLSADLEKIAHASYLLEITDGLTAEREENQPLFEHLKEGLLFIEQSGISLAFLAFFDLKLLRLAGYQPMLERCRRCGRGSRTGPSGKWCFSLRDGGVLCEGCAAFRKEIVPLSLEALCALADLQKAGDAPSHHTPFPFAVLHEGRSVLLRFIQFQINRELKSAHFLDAFSSA